jgi:hypothetical protein
MHWALDPCMHVTLYHSYVPDASMADWLQLRTELMTVLWCVWLQ